LNPVVSDLCIMAQAEGMPYTDLINEILYLAAGRYVQQSRGHERRARTLRSMHHAWASAPMEGM